MQAWMPIVYGTISGGVLAVLHGFFAGYYSSSEALNRLLERKRFWIMLAGTWRWSAASSAGGQGSLSGDCI
ncbi:MAG: hypothetical protein R2881_08250 [Eubacteriales bacterium]